MKCLQLNFDIICLSEIGQINIQNSLNFFENYNYYCDNSIKKNGGITCLVKKEIQVLKIRNDLKLPQTVPNDENYLVENLWLECKLENWKKSIIIGAIYRHPKGKVSIFNEKYENSLKKIDSENKNCIICGDLNIDALAINHADSQNFYNLNLAENFIPHINIPTRITDNTATLIDQIFFKHNNHTLEENIITGNLFTDLTDHFPNFILYGNQNNLNLKPKKKYVRIHSKKNLERFNEYLQSNETWLEYNDETDCNKAANIFVKNLKNGYEKYFPLKQLSIKRAKDKKWITAGIRKSCNTKNRLYKKFLSIPNIENKTRYKNYRNTLNRICKLAQENYFTSLINDTKHSLTKLWQIFGPIINPLKKRKSQQIEKLKINGEYIIDRQKITNHFNDYFCNIGKDLSKKIPNTRQNYKHYLGNNNVNSIFINPVSDAELLKIVNNLNNKKSQGMNDIPIKIFKASYNNIKLPLLKLVNMSFSQGKFPEILKIAKVIPLYKKEDKYLTENYRPISILSYISKIIEKLMKNRLNNFLIKNEILYTLQFGFRQDYSTNLATINILEDINTCLDEGKWSISLFLDFKKAFDTVNHEILLHKLYHYGIRGIAHNWFTTYLNNRNQYVQIEDTKSQLQKIETGVPQGSVLGPILFILYINDITSAINDQTIKTVLFADDTNVYMAGKDILDLKQKAKNTLNELQKWFNANKLTLNLDKTHYCIYHPARKKIPNNCDEIQVGDNKITRVSSIKYLGLNIDENVNWNIHIKQIKEQLIKLASSFKLIKHYIPYNCKRQLYYAYVYSNVIYCIETYGHTSKSNIKARLQIRPSLCFIV